MPDGEDAELEEIRRRKMMELQQKAQEEALRQETAEHLEAKKMILRQILAPEARERLASLRLARPEIAEAVEQQLILLAQSGKLRQVVTDAMLKQILARFLPPRREIKIERR